MNEEMIYAAVAPDRESELSSPSLSDGPAQSEKGCSTEGNDDAKTISDAWLYLVAMDAFFSGFLPANTEEREK